jgi:L-alanine-DL-glutamate epimerase-like enolase superfamily enzyme
MLAENLKNPVPGPRGFSRAFANPESDYPAMSKIDRVEVHEFAFELPDLGWDGSGFNIVYQPGNRLALSKYALVIRTADGGKGEYVALWGGTPMALGQTLALAPHLIGRDAHQRERIYDDFKRALRQYDHMGFGCIDIALWDWAGKQFGAPVARLLGDFRERLPAYTGACPARATMWRLPSSATASATGRSRCMAGVTAMSLRSARQCSRSARRFAGE